MRTESERRGGAGDEATYSPTAARAPEFEQEVTVDPVVLWRCGGSLVGCSRSGNRLDGGYISIHPTIFNTVDDYPALKLTDQVIADLSAHTSLSRASLDEFSEAVRAKGAPLQNCWGFVDGTALPFCRPTQDQRLYFSGHKRVHAIKYQGSMCANGIIVEMNGLYPGHRHDAELQGRLKAAREKNTDLKRKLNSVSNQSQVQEKSFQEYLREIERLKTEQYKSSKSIEERKQELSELSNKLGKKTKGNEALQHELGEVKKELFLGQLNAQQLEDAQASEDVHSQLEELHQEKLGMQKKVNNLKDAMEQIAAEKRQMSSHYQSYVDRLSAAGNKQGNAGETNTHEFSTLHIRVRQRRPRVFNWETLLS
ncbi:uncharacterized protein ISCGN_003702 [Ixodes scapularis]